MKTFIMYLKSGTSFFTQIKVPQDKHGPFGLTALSLGLWLNLSLSFSLSIQVVGVGCASRAGNVCSEFIQR